MAIDGVKIIHGDTAHDTYWGIMDLYDSGADFDTINKNFPLNQADCYDDFDKEVYVTSCALALWEIGQMTDEKLNYIKAIIDKGVCVTEWSKINENDGKARQKELDKFWKKISQTNTKIRARKKHRKITNFFFQPDDLLAFQLKDGSYRAVICASINQYRKQCYYSLVPTTYNACKKPTVDDLKDNEILGRLIECDYNQETIRKKQPGIDRIWEFVGGNCNFLFGVSILAVDHKDFIHFKDKFEKVGTLKIIEGLKDAGSFGYETNFESFQMIFSDLENHIKKFEFKKYPVTTLCEI